MSKNYISLPDAARKYNCTQGRLRKAASRGEISHYRQMGRIFLDDEEVGKALQIIQITTDNK